VRYAILSDIHANLEALRAVLDDVGGQADGFLCLGDVVGYGADPVGCVDLVAQRAAVTVAGNHEHAVAGLLDLAWFNPNARAAAAWTRTRLDGDARAWLGARPLQAQVDDATLVHASPARPEEWDYLVTASDGWTALSAVTTRLCFIGHTHLPGVWAVGPSGPVHAPGAEAVELEPDGRYLINVGSVGQPRDRDRRAAYALWDMEADRVTIRRVAYDVAGARRKIVAAGLPRLLADRLAVGA
jgi:diadenosine tetraphosphatase ApaH/serine/threonine PP2A family protein phosphatase